MKYISTRGKLEECSFEDVVLAGLAPEGGLYIPTHIPSLPDDWKTAWENLSYQDLAVKIISLFVSEDEVPHNELQALVEKTYAVNPLAFRKDSITPLIEMTPQKLYVLELFHGPTYAFKDLALQLVGNLFEYFLTRRNKRKSPGEKPEKLTVVGATSGDTGSAAIYGLRKKDNISVFIMFPKGRVSQIQEAQMTTVLDPNVHNLSVSGTFDNCQDILKALLADKEFNEKHSLGAVNSINWARILCQIVYYFSAYFQLRKLPSFENGSEIQFVVPTGNFGDILAGYYAKRLGLPMGKLGVATNQNDILARFWKSGAYEKVDPKSPPVEGGVHATTSPAMDIAVSSNFERLLWYLAYEKAQGTGDNEKRAAACTQVDKWMKDVKKSGSVDLTDVLTAAQRDFVAHKVDDKETLKTIGEYYSGEKGGKSYLVDPHTAVGLSAAELFASTSDSKSTVQIVLSTAHPAKFADAVEKALGENSSFDPKTVFGNLLERERRVEHIEGAEHELVGLVKNVIDKFASQ
ncbi:hypothetical protein HYDPIDRAFT_111332 [Hydnomerulius pinastri MD-312]|uniref:threonine synthase n=1 Tax=Hydnomerulius pinastri MD-312 TaxID=994086 RepID=A0A0C9VGP6_9AGAM|nr:hypothetical protein HYDPIDRAFT_111332 [Hydnomerulius pinastri MD-312]